MRKTVASIIFLLISILSIACCLDDTKLPKPSVINLINSTVELTAIDQDTGRYSLYCGAVWVAPNVLITANHCVVAAARKAETENADLVPITFRTPNDDQEYMASVIVREPSHDLALLLTETGIIHEIAPLADKISIGEPLQIVGHPAGLEYTYIVGVVAQIRDHYDDDNFIQDMMLPLEPPWLQVSADVFFGNSGGGAFNKDGQLVGISSFMMRLPATGFFIPVSEVRALMIGQHLLKARLY